MKRFDNRRRWVLIGLAAVTSLAVAIFLLCMRPPTSFRFLGELAPVYRREAGRRTTDIYSFEGHFEDVCARAAVELSARGFREGYQGIGSPEYDQMFIKETYHRVVVSIKGFAFESADQNTAVYTRKPGWVSVEVHYTRRSLWRDLQNRWQAWRWSRRGFPPGVPIPPSFPPKHVPRETPQKTSRG